MMHARKMTNGGLYLAAALALYAWRSRARWFPSQSAPDAGNLANAETRRQPVGRDGSPNAAGDSGDGHAATGITDLRPQDEGEQQSALPPRGARKDRFHA